MTAEYPVPNFETEEISRYADFIVETIEARRLDQKFTSEYEREHYLNYFGAETELMSAYAATGGRKTELFIEGIKKSLRDPSVSVNTKTSTVYLFRIGLRINQLDDVIDEIQQLPQIQQDEAFMDVFNRVRATRELAQRLINPPRLE